MIKKLIVNARIVSPGLDLVKASVLIDGDRIESIFKGGKLPSSPTRIDAAGKLLMPGFIDIHSHGADGCDTGDDSLESLRHIARRKLQEGVTTWLPTTLTLPREKLRSIAAKVATFQAQGDLTRCPGLHVEGPFINRTMAGAQNPRFIRPPDFAEIEELHAIAPVKILSLAPELPGAIELIKRCHALDVLCSAAHTAATADQISAACDAGLRHLTHFGNAMTPLHHREIGVVGAGLLDDRLMVEVIADGVHLSPDMLRLIFKVVPIHRLMAVTDSVAASWIVNGELRLGGLEVEVKDRIARLKHGGALAGSTLLANEALRLLFETTGLPLSELTKVMSWNQARALGLDHVGRIAAGYLADLVLLNPDFSVARTFVGGEER